MADITHGTWIKDGSAVDAVYQGGVKVYGRNLSLNTSIPNSVQGNGASTVWQDVRKLNLSQNPAGLTVTFSYAVTIDKPDSGKLYMQFGNDFSPAWGMPVAVNLSTLKTGVKTNFHSTIVFPKYIGSGNFNECMIGIVQCSALVKFEDLKIEQGSVATPWSPAPEDILK
ncbi:hypothetical protein [Lactiplantibacillus plantarum]|uniref:hypothetical protein n=1 Tax=Lactiplantibacillus plantarum TaxID=1590 RepID=UPI0013D0CE5B|nr:hypothetical protein [Lactiplantibacillus plantarum]